MKARDTSSTHPALSILGTTTPHTPPFPTISDAATTSSSYHSVPLLFIRTRPKYPVVSWYRRNASRFARALHFCRGLTPSSKSNMTLSGRDRPESESSFWRAREFEHGT